MPADPQSKGWSENTVKIAKADLVPTDHNLRDEYASTSEVQAACEQWMSDVNTRPHRSTQEPPVIRLAEEHERLHRVPVRPHTVVFGETRKVSWQSTVSVGSAVYSVPHELVDQTVWVRAAGDELIALMSLEWIGRAETLVICGPSGTGKTHFIEALGHLAIDRGKTVAWHTPDTLAALIHRRRADNSINKAISKLIRTDLVVIDLCRYRDYADIVAMVGLNAPALLGFSVMAPASLSAWFQRLSRNTSVASAGL